MRTLNLGTRENHRGASCDATVDDRIRDYMHAHRRHGTNSRGQKPTRAALIGEHRTGDESYHNILFLRISLAGMYIILRAGAELHVHNTSSILRCFRGNMTSWLHLCHHNQAIVHNGCVVFLFHFLKTWSDGCACVCVSLCDSVPLVCACVCVWGAQVDLICPFMNSKYSPRSTRFWDV